MLLLQLLLLLIDGLLESGQRAGFLVTRSNAFTRLFHLVAGWFSQAIALTPVIWQADGIVPLSAVGLAVGGIAGGDLRIRVVFIKFSRIDLIVLVGCGARPVVVTVVFCALICLLVV